MQLQAAIWLQAEWVKLSNWRPLQSWEEELYDYEKQLNVLWKLIIIRVPLRALCFILLLALTY